MIEDLLQAMPDTEPTGFDHRFLKKLGVSFDQPTTQASLTPEDIEAVHDNLHAMHSERIRQLEALAATQNRAIGVLKLKLIRKSAKGTGWWIAAIEAALLIAIGVIWFTGHAQ